MINANSHWARAAILAQVTCALLATAPLAAQSMPRLITEEERGFAVSKSTSPGRLLKVWIPKGSERYALAVRAPGVWSLDYPKMHNARSDSDTFIIVRVMPPKGIIAGRYPIEMILSKLDQNDQVLSSQNFVYQHEITSDPRAKFSLPPGHSFFVSSKGQERVELTIQNQGTSMLRLRPSRSNSAIFPTGYAWPLDLDVNESMTIPIEVTPALYSKQEDGRFRILVSLTDEYTGKAFTESLEYSVYEEGNMNREWFTMPHSITLANYFRDANMDRGLILKGKGKLGPQSNLMFDYEARLRDVYENKDPSLSGLGYISLSDKKTSTTLSAGDLTLATRGMISKGERGRGIVLHKNKGRLRFEAYHQRAWDYITDRPESDKKLRSSAMIGRHFDQGSHVILRGYDEENKSQFTGRLQFVELDAKAKLGKAHTISGIYARQVNGKPVDTTPYGDSSQSDAARLEWSYGTPQASMQLRTEYAGASYHGAFNDAFKGFASASRRWSKLSSALQYYYVYHNLNDNPNSNNSLIEQSGNARLGYIFNKMFSLSGAVKLESSSSHLDPSATSSYRRGQGRLEAVLSPWKALRVNLRGEVEGHDYYNLSRTTYPLYNSHARITWSPSPIFSCFVAHDNHAIVTQVTDDLRERRYSYGFKIDNRRDTRLSVSWSDKYTNSSKFQTMLTNYTYKISKFWEVNFRLNATKQDDDSQVYDGQFALMHNFSAPLYKPALTGAVAIDVQLPSDYYEKEPLLLQAGARTVKVSKSGRYESMVAQGKNKLFFINLPREYITTSELSPLFVQGKEAEKVQIQIVKAGQFSLQIQKRGDFAAALINPDKDVKTLQEFLMSMPLTLENRLTGEMIVLKQNGRGLYEAPRLRPGKWRLSFPEPLFPQLAFNLSQDEINIAPGERASAELKIIPKKRELQLISTSN